jgi:hypothetical protein
MVIYRNIFGPCELFIVHAKLIIKLMSYDKMWTYFNFLPVHSLQDNVDKYEHSKII